MKQITRVAAFLASLIGPAAGAADPSTAAAAGSAHALAFEAIDGGALPLSAYAGRAVLVVNTASRCGFTPQYDGLQALWTAYKDRGLVVLGVPANDFGAQEPGTNAEIADFCEVNFGIDFPMAAKATVVGSDAHPFYRWAKGALGEAGTPKWNFHKILIGPDGVAVAGFSSRVAPDAPELRRAIEAALPPIAPAAP
jgi:glutathione peroxidase